MAEKKLNEIRTRAIQEYDVIDLTIIHRVGTLPVGENIVLIVAAAPPGRGIQGLPFLH